MGLAKQIITSHIRFQRKSALTQFELEKWNGSEGNYSAQMLREYLLWLESRGHNPVSILACYRALKNFLYWWESEIEPEGWTNPIRKVKTPRNPIPPLQPVELAEVEMLLETCENNFLGKRDKAIILCLLDTGVRAS